MDAIGLVVLVVYPIIPTTPALLLREVAAGNGGRAFIGAQPHGGRFGSARVVGRAPKQKRQRYERCK
jgi:hypothetical protein